MDTLPSDWPVALECLSNRDTRYWNRLIIPIYATLKQADALSEIPARIRSILQSKFMELLSIQTCQQFWLKKVVGKLIEKQIPVILLKGAAAIGTLYEPNYARLSQDIDLLVKKCDIQKISDVIKKLGTPRPQNANRIFSEQHSHEQNIPLNTELAFNIEPHTDLHPRFFFRIDHREIWNRSVAHPLFNSEYIRILSNEHAIVYMATHSFFHLEFEPHHLVDAYRLMSKNNPNMEIAENIARNWRCSTILFAVCEQLQYWFDYSNPVTCSQSAKRRLLVLGTRFRTPLCPSTHDVTFPDQIRSLILHDSLFRVVLFSVWFLYKKVMDRLHLLFRISQIGLSSKGL